MADESTAETTLVELDEGTIDASQYELVRCDAYDRYVVVVVKERTLERGRAA